MVTLWTAVEYSDERWFMEETKKWYPKESRRRHYYAVARPSELAAYPSKGRGHRRYGIYVSAGKYVVSDSAVNGNLFDEAEAFTVKGESGLRYVLGRDDTVYYKILSHGPNALSIKDDPARWNSIPGVAITEEQYEELRKCNFRDSCRSFLSATDLDLSPGQREYVEKHRISKSDMKPHIKVLRRMRRQHERWL